MRASAVAAQSTYAAIVNMVAAAQTAKAPFIRMADRFAMVMLPATLIVAGHGLVFLGRPHPCAGCACGRNALPADPGGAGRLHRRRLARRRAEGSDEGQRGAGGAGQARTAVFDKTGTLTHGGAELIEVETAPGRDPDKALRLLASLEQASHHVLADNIVAVAREKGLALSNPSDVREYRGAGLEGVVDDMSVRAGSRALVLPTSLCPVGGDRVN